MHKLLIIDDDLALTSLLTDYFSAQQFDVEVANSPDQGLIKLKDRDYDLLLLDVMMPVMDGFEFRLLQSQSPRISKIPVLVTTGDTDSSISKRMMYPMKIEHKPLQITPLLESITQCLSGEQPSSIQL